MTEPEGKFSICADVVCKSVGGGKNAILLNIDNGYYYVLNEVAMMIWDGIKEGMTSAEMVATITNEFEVDRQQARADLRSFTGQLVKESILRAGRDDLASRGEGSEG